MVLANCAVVGGIARGRQPPEKIAVLSAPPLGYVGRPSSAPFD